MDQVSPTRGDRSIKPTGMKGYGSIPHLPGSRLGVGDHHISEGQARIATEKVRDRHERVIVTEKLDGSNTSVAKIDGQIIALGRAGYEASTSPYVQHKMFADWVKTREPLFQAMLSDGQRVVGEWMAQAHGSLYSLSHGPWVPFDIFTGKNRWPHDAAKRVITSYGLPTPHVIHDGIACSIEQAMTLLGKAGFHGCDPEDGAEGAVWRVEYRGEFNFLTKYVRHDKVDGKYLPSKDEIGSEIWNWKPGDGA